MVIEFNEQRTLAWWEKLNSKELTSDRTSPLTDWLTKLYKTETMGYHDNMAIIDRYNLTGIKARILEKTAKDELKHSYMLRDLLANRGVTDLEVDNIPDSEYWEKMGSHVGDNLEREFAVLYLGESLASHRFNFIQSSQLTPNDVLCFVKSALPDELYHAEIFKRLSTPEAITDMLSIHNSIISDMTSKYGDKESQS